MKTKKITGMLDASMDNIIHDRNALTIDVLKSILGYIRDGRLDSATAFTKSAIRIFEKSQKDHRKTKINWKKLGAQEAK